MFNNPFPLVPSTPVNPVTLHPADLNLASGEAHLVMLNTLLDQLHTNHDLTTKTYDQVMVNGGEPHNLKQAYRSALNALEMRINEIQVDQGYTQARIWYWKWVTKQTGRTNPQFSDDLPSKEGK